MNVLFVCLGNICRSPAAQSIFEKKLELKNLSQQFFVDSCGTSNYHEGQKADLRMRQHAAKRSYKITSISRGFQFPRDFKEFDLILAMDQTNLKDLLSYHDSEKYHSKVQLMTSFCKKFQLNSVPDPYFGGQQGFEQVLDILEDACENLLIYLLEQN